MKLYYLQSEYSVGKHRIVKALYDDEVFKFDEGTLSPFNTLTIDEVDPLNKALCLGLYRTQNRADVEGENKHHVNAQGQLIEKVGWEEYINADI